MWGSNWQKLRQETANLVRSYKISPLMMLIAINVLIVGELICGTSLYFVAMMALTMAAIGITYNLLGGLGTFGGFLFTGFAFRTIVFSQFAKVFLLEPADKTLEDPSLTITVYAAFYISSMVGAFIFSRARLPLPKPKEPVSTGHARVLYLVSVSVGIVASIVYETYNSTYGTNTVYSSTRSWALNLSYLLLFSQVLAIDIRIRESEGQHSFGLAASIPWLVSTTLSFFDTVRTGIIAPTLIYFVTCYFRGYRFRPRHYIAACLGITVFYAFISPLEVYTRETTGIKDMTWGDRIYTSIHTVGLIPSRAALAAFVATHAEETDPREQYFERPGTYTLSRLAVIKADSTLISATAQHHYGFAQLEEVATSSLPSFIYKNKSRVRKNNYVANVSGLGADDPTAQPVITAVADSYGAFGWTGVILFPMLAFSAIFVVYESMFNMTKPWGTVALGMSFLAFGEMSMGRIFPLLFRDPLNILVLSYGIGWLTRLVPVRADSVPNHPVNRVVWQARIEMSKENTV
jgi:hypothetical protein